MITTQKSVLNGTNSDGTPCFYIEGVCLSTDDPKPTDVANGSRLMEMDTGKLYLFDAEGTQWLEWTVATDPVSQGNG